MTQEMMEQVMVRSIRERPCSVTLADPDLPDCPLIGCSEGFQVMTGYRRSEILGRNCRFLNQGVGLAAPVREALRRAAREGCEFVGVLANRRANGELFKNLLHMTTLTVQGKRYIIGVQSDVTSCGADVGSGHIEEIKRVSDQIFSANIDAWVQMQAQEFSIKVPLPYAEMLKTHSPEQYGEAQREFVVAGAPEAPGPPDTGLKSIGSLDHPDKCTECQFFFFYPGGCRSGANCGYCHELHLRRSSKKNRRLLKRIAEREAMPEEGVPGSQAENGDSKVAEGASVMSLRYPAAPGPSGKGTAQTPPPLVFLVGQVVKLPALLEAEEAKRRALQACLLFEVAPPLPPGLELDESTGEIRGVPSAPAERQTYVVSVSTQATGPGGVELGLVRVASCRLPLRVADLAGYRPFSVREEAEVDGVPRLVVEFYPAKGDEGAEST